MRIYEIYCCGHVKKIKSTGGYTNSRIYFCSGCCMRPVRRLLKNCEASELYEDALVCESALTFAATAITCI